jgi:broad specificity phosphatase PhoE
MSIYLIRHAESKGNARQVLQGALDFDLTARGLEQAGALARWLGDLDLHPQRVFCSPQRRALRTAEIISTALGGPRPQALPELREINPGRLEGLTLKEILAEYPDFGRGSRFAPQDTSSWGAESYAKLDARVAAFRQLVEERHASEHVLAVSHGGVIYALVKHWCGWPVPWQFFTHMSNCCCYKLELRESEGRNYAELQWFVSLEIIAPELADSLTVHP